MQRKFNRNSLRKLVGNKDDNLQMAWQRFQMNKYGEDYHKICRGYSKRGNK